MVSPEALHRMTVVSALESDKTVLVKLASQYGQQVALPANEQAELFCQIAGIKTLTPRVRDLIKKLGYRIEVVQDLPKEL